MDTPESLDAAVQRLLAARQCGLATLPVARIVDAIDAAVARWQDPGYHLRRLAEEQLPAVTGYSAPMVREGLPLLLEPFRRQGLLDLLRSELRDPATLDGPHPTLLGPRLTTIVLAGNIPAVPVEAIVHALLVKSACLVKAASGDPLFPKLFARSLAEADPEIGAAVAVLHWKGGDLSMDTRALASAGAVIAYGTDSSIQALRGPTLPTTHFIGYGHRVSFAAVGRDALHQDGLRDLAARAAWDIGLFDQQGCVSPHCVFVERGGHVSPMAFAEALAGEMETLESRLPRGAISTAEAAAIQQLRQAWEMRQAAAQPVRLLCSRASTAWTVLYEEDAPFTASCLNRVVRVIALDDLTALPSLLAPVQRHLQTAGIAVAQDRLPSLATLLAHAGVTRVCPIGRMQHPPASWPHDGQPNLLPLLRSITITL